MAMLIQTSVLTGMGCHSREIGAAETPIDHSPKLFPMLRPGFGAACDCLLVKSASIGSTLVGALITLAQGLVLQVGIRLHKCHYP